MKHWILPLLAAAAVIAQTHSGTAAQMSLKAAMDKEIVDGDLRSAIAMYRQVANKHKDNKPVAAQALLRLGQCQERAGEQEAAKAYERLLEQYGDQKEAAAARSRLAAIRTPGAQVRGSVQAKLLWDQGPSDWAWISRDGRYLSFVNWATYGVGIRDLATGISHVVPDPGNLFGKGKGEPGATVISPDGARVAFAYFRHGQQGADAGRYELHIIGADGTGHKILFAKPGAGYVEPGSFSPDGKQIAATVLLDGEARLGIFAADGGREPVFAPANGKTRINSSIFSPDGKWLLYSASAIKGAPNSVYLCPASAGGNEIKIADTAVAMGWAPDSSAVLYTKVREGKGLLFHHAVVSGKPSGAPLQIATNADIRGVPMGVTGNGTLVYGIRNAQADALIFPFDGDVMKIAAGASPVSSFAVTDYPYWLLAGGAMRFSPDGKRVAGVAPSGRDIVVRPVAATDTNPIQTINVPFRGFLRMEWAADSEAILVMTEVQPSLTGVHRYDLRTGQWQHVTDLPREGSANFLLSHDGLTLYYGSNTGVVSRDLATGRERQLWSSGRDAGGNFQLLLSPDGRTLALRGSYYLGVVDLGTGAVRDLYRTSETLPGAPVWASAFSTDGKQILTILRVKMSQMEFTAFPVNGETPKQAGIRLPSEWRGLAISPDGKWIATTQLKRRDQVWALENFLPAANR